MKTLPTPLAGLLACLLFPSFGRGASPDTGNVVLTPAPKPLPPWEIKVGTPGWIATTTGYIGVHGITTHISVGPVPVVRHSNFLASVSGEFRLRRWGVMGDLVYDNAQASQSGSGLVNKIDLGFQAFLGELFVYYRLLETPRCSLDLLTGFRYTYQGNQDGLQGNEQNINTASTELVNQVATAVVTPGSDLNSLVQKTIVAQLTSLSGKDPKLPVGPLAARLPEAIGAEVLGIIESRQEELQGALRDAIRSGVQSRVNQVKAELAKEISAQISSQLSRSISIYPSWVDPTFGVRGRYNFTKALYLTGETDVGGFGIGSDIAWQGQAAFGIQLTRNIYTEIGYRFYYDDYRDKDYLYQITLHGAQVTLGVNF